uniref:NADH dehydrogenase subunit 6 n=1 Tax=Sinanodonta woodiana TaxID=1069815 RepID=A0A346HGW3_SINWO|nr:NADH dehydrogenase subunit 6 [Sinanodonta woodiana]AXO78649.1 NADH dehydrogenase subunit 6 [Sinanodonta woodiana]
MTLLLFMTMMIFSMLNAMISSHPLTMSMKILLFALILCLTIGFTTTWYAYMIFMIMLGGVLVMFTYISSMAPNSIYKSKINLPLLSIQTITALFVGYNSNKFSPKSFNTQNSIFLPENFITFFLSTKNCDILIMMTSILLLSMLVITTLLSKSKSAMRPTLYL